MARYKTKSAFTLLQRNLPLKKTAIGWLCLQVILSVSKEEKSEGRSCRRCCVLAHPYTQGTTFLVKAMRARDR
jgi:hypothetical protein